MAEGKPYVLKTDENFTSDYEDNYVSGYVSLFRSFINWEWFTEPNMVTVFIYCLLKANYKDTKWRGFEIEKGSFITSYESISNDTGLTIQNVRTCINKLIKTKEIEKTSTNKNTVIRVVKYSVYQQRNEPPNKQTNKQLTNNQQTTNKQLTTDNNYNNINNLKKIMKEGFLDKTTANVFLNIQRCKEKYLADQKIVNAVCLNKKNNITKTEIESRLEKFNQTLTEQGNHTKEFPDYCKHFLAWHKKNKSNAPNGKKQRFL